MHEEEIVRVGIGEARTARAPKFLFTILGSCVAVILYDKVAKVGGLLHVMLGNSHGKKEDPCKYADTGIPYLIKLMVRNGAAPQRLKGAKIMGGSEMWQINEKSFNVGLDNITEVKSVLARHGIKVIASDLGGETGRRVTMKTSSGKVKVESSGHETVIL